MRLPPSAEALPLPLNQARWTAVAETGLSGALVYRSDTNVACKCWPIHFEAEYLRQIHDWMKIARPAGSRFVPEVLPWRNGETVLRANGHLWDLTTWMPGDANFQRKPTRPKLQAACEALAELHRAWAEKMPAASHRPVTAPAILRRLRLFSEWQRAVTETSLDELADADAILRTRLPEAREKLHEWQSFEVAVQPCLCDVRNDHVLFTGDTLTGLIDYGAMKFDTPAVDLARMLGDLVGHDHPWFVDGLQWYFATRPPILFPAELAHLLAWTADLGGLANWRLRYPALKTQDDRLRALHRVQVLLSRVVPPESGRPTSDLEETPLK